MIKKVGIIVVIIGLGILYIINPEQSVFMPKCPFHWLTGWECPACGSQRAIHQLLHGNFREAFGYNPFLLVSVPYLSTLIWVEWFDDKNKFVRLKSICHDRRIVNVYLILILIWWVARNLI